MLEFPPLAVMAAVLILVTSLGALHLSRAMVTRSVALLAAIISAVIATMGAATSAEAYISLAAATSIGVVGAGMVLAGGFPPACRRTYHLFPGSTRFSSAIKVSTE